MEEIIYLNGSLIPRSQARVSVYDHGFLYGFGLFETMRAYNGTIFLLDRHLDRLLRSARVIGLDLELTATEFAGACIGVLTANKLKDARLRLTVSRGEVDSFPGPAACQAPTVLVTAKGYSPLPSPSRVYNKGYRAVVSSLHRYSQSPLSGLKTTNYLLSIMARMQSEAAGMEESLLLNEQGFIAEGSISNVFFVTSPSHIVTPSLGNGILPGITREVVMELAVALGIDVIEGDVRLEDLGRFDEAFLTNSVMEVMPLVEVRDSTGKVITIGSGKPGELTRRLMAAYREKVEQETFPA